MSAILLTGQSGAGKTTLACQLKLLVPQAVILDGDDLRTGLNSDLGFTDGDIMENMRRIGELSKLLQRNGHPLVIISAIAPLLEGRRLLRRNYNIREFLILQGNCRERDVKGLYKAGTRFRQYERADNETHAIIHINNSTPREIATEILEYPFLLDHNSPAQS